MKKISALILSLVLVVSALYIPAFSEAESEAVTAKQLALLAAFDIIEDADSVDLEKSLTRAQAAEYFCKLTDISAATASGYDSVYYDVTTETPYFGYIKAVSDMGYMIGYPDGRFRPVQNISTKEAARVLANILGFKDYIAVTSFDAVMLKTGIMDGVKIRDAVTCGEFLKMIYNALHAPACKIVGFGDGISYEISQDYLGAEHLRGVVSDRAVLDATSDTGLDEILDTINDNTVSIGGTVHNYDGDASAFLGYRVKYYYKADADGKDVVFMTKDEKNNELILNYDEIISYSDFTYTYEQNNKDKEVKISKSASIIFNGGAYPALDPEEMVPAYGKVTLVDNNNDKTFDVVLIDSVEFILAESTNPSKMTIFAVQDGKDLELENSDEVSVTKDGKAYDFDRIINRDLLAVRRTKVDSGYDKVVIEVLKDAKANSRLGSVTDERVTVGEVTYKLWDGMDEDSRSEIKAGATVTLYTYEDMIVIVEVAGSMNSYGYLVSVSEPEIFGDTIQFRLMQTDLKAATFDMNKNVKIDGVACKAADIKARLLESAKLSVKPYDEGEVAQPVKYTLNSEGKLIALDTLYFDADHEDAETSLRRLETESYKYSRTSSSFYNRDTGAFVAATKDNRAYRVPFKDVYSELDYEYYNLAEGMSLNTWDYDYIDVCNVDPDSRVADFAYVYRLVFNHGTWGSFIVQDKTQALNDDGDVVKTLEVIDAGNGNLKTQVINEAAYAAYEKLNPGDFIRITTNIKSEVIGISDPSTDAMPSLVNPSAKRVFKLGGGNHGTTNPPYADGECMVVGTVLDASSGKLLLTTCLESDPGEFDETVGRDSLPLSSAKVMIMEDLRGNISFTEGSVEDLKTYADDPENASVVVVYISGSTVRTVFVLEEK